MVGWRAHCGEKGVITELGRMETISGEDVAAFVAEAEWHQGRDGWLDAFDEMEPRCGRILAFFGGVDGMHPVLAALELAKLYVESGERCLLDGTPVGGCD